MITISHDEAKRVHRIMEENLSHSSNNQSIESLEFRNRIREIAGSGKPGSLNDTAAAFYGQHFA